MLAQSPPVVKFSLPFPDKILNPNDRSHWRIKAHEKKTAREAAYYLTRDQGIELDPQKRYVADLIFHPPDKRWRDLDNLSASMKSALDGMCGALGINDRNLRPIPDWGDVVQGGRVDITLWEMDA
jgi:crossover junction endodeoxyribonuclease RusA